MNDGERFIARRTIGGCRLYKVLRANRTAAISGFSYGPYLPTKDGKPGNWLPEVGRLEWCQLGYHLTVQPRMWKMYRRDRVFLTEGRGPALNWGKICHYGDKLLFRSVRLIREVKWSEVPKHSDHFAVYQKVCRARDTSERWSIRP